MVPSLRLRNGIADEPIIESVHAAIMARPYDDWAVTQIASLRAQELEPGRIVRHIRQVEADFADAIEEHLAGDNPPKPGTDERMHITVTARCIAAAVFGAMEVWMLGRATARCPSWLGCAGRRSTSLGKGIGDLADRSFVIIDKTAPCVSASADDGL